MGPGQYKIRIQLRKTASRPRKEVERVVQVEDIKAAWAIRQELYEELVRGEQPHQERLTLRTYASSWLASRALRLAHSTAERYASTLELHVLPELGDFYLDALVKRDVEDWVVRKAGLTDKKTGKRVYANGTINGWVQVLKTMMADACDEYRLPNPVLRVLALPEGRAEDDPNSLTEDELQVLLAAFKEHAPQDYPLVLTLALTGLRWGEATALKWGDLDREKGVIRVRRAHWHGHVKSTKTGKPRMVPLPPQLLEVLDAWRATMVREQHPGLESGWCFPADQGGLRFTSTMTKPMRKCLKKAKVTKKVNIQGLRRSAEDILRRLNVAGPLAEALMGHSTRMRSHYSTVAEHEVASVGRQVVRRLGLVLSNVGDRVGDQDVSKKNA